jgi:GntR family transcriptional regulator
MESIPRPLKTSTRPLYGLTIAAINEFIEKNQYKPGDRLPAEEDLAGQFGISRSTLREALGFLESQGVVTRRHGVGTFVTAPSKAIIDAGLEQLESYRNVAARAGIKAERKDWEVDLVPANEVLAEVLAVEAGTPLVRVQVTAVGDGLAFGYFDSYTPESLVNLDELRAYNKGSLLEYLIERTSLRVAYTRSEIHAVEARPRVAAKLGLAIGKPLLHLAEVYYTDTGRAVVRSLNYFVTQNFTFHIIRKIALR